MNLLPKMGAFLLSACFLTTALPANASFVGDTVSVNYEWPTVGSVIFPGGSAVVTSGGTTFDMAGGASVATVTDSAINVTFPNGWSFSTAPKAFDGIVITDLAADITGTSLASTNITGYLASDVTFDTHDVYIDFPYPPFTSLDPGATLTINAAFVPEPTSGALLSLGVIGLAALWQTARRVSG